MKKTVIIYRALKDGFITQADGCKQPVKAGNFIAYDTANHGQFLISEQEIAENYTFVHNDQYIRKTA